MSAIMRHVWTWLEKRRLARYMQAIEREKVWIAHRDGLMAEMADAMAIALEAIGKAEKEIGAHRLYLDDARWTIGHSLSWYTVSLTTTGQMALMGAYGKGEHVKK